MSKSNKPRVMSRGTAYADSSVEQKVWDKGTEEFHDVVDKNVERFAIDYSRKSGSDVQHERLPKQSDLSDMELTFRERSLPADLLARYTQREFAWLMAIAICSGYGMAVLLPILRSWLHVLFFPLCGLGVFIGFQVLLRKQSLLLAVFIIVGVPIAAVILGVLSLLMAIPGISGLVVCVFAVPAIFFFGRDIFRFYEDWILTEPRLKPETREAEARIRGYGPSVLLAILVYGCGSLIGITHRGHAFVVVAVLLLTAFIVQLVPVLFTKKRGAFLSHVKTVFSLYLTYGMTNTGAAGVWHPHRSARARRTRLSLLICIATFALMVSLDGFLPTDYIVFSEKLGGVSSQFHYRYTLGWVSNAIYVLIKEHDPFVLMLFPASLIFSLLVTPLFFASLFLMPLSRSFRRYQFIRKELDVDDRTEWQWYVDRMRSSDHISRDPVTGQKNEEKRHLFLGVEPVAHHPVLLDTRILSEHAYIVGESGSGKTSMGVMPIVLQLIRGDSAGADEPHKFTRAKIQVSHQCESCGATAKIWGPARTQLFKCPKCDTQMKVNFADAAMRNPEDPPPPMIIIDLKGDAGLFHTVREEAEARAPGSFRWFTPEKGFSSHVFNPFDDLATADRSLQQICELFLESLGLAHGDGYGRSYFTRQNRVALLEALKSEPPPRSFEDLMQRLVELQRLRPEEFSDIAELTSTIRVLMEYPQLALQHKLARPELGIHMPAVLEQRQVVYFWLPAALESVSVREIAKLALYSFLSAAIARQRAGKPVRQSYLIIDEFQRIVGDNFRIVLEQARSFGIGVILANQSKSDLQTPTADLRPTVNTNTRLKMMFSLSDPKEISDLRATSGEEMIEFLSQSESVALRADGNTQTVSLSAQNSIQPRLSVNEILSASDHPLDFIMQVSRGSGYTQFGGLPIRVRTNYPISAKAYSRRSTQKSWPELEPYELKERTGTVNESTPEEIEDTRESFATDFQELLEKEFSRQQKRFASDEE